MFTRESSARLIGLVAEGRDQASTGFAHVGFQCRAGRVRVAVADSLSSAGHPPVG